VGSSVFELAREHEPAAQAGVDVGGQLAQLGLHPLVGTSETWRPNMCARILRGCDSRSVALLRDIGMRPDVATW
jgi:hypothetical protein